MFSKIKNMDREIEAKVDESERLIHEIQLNWLINGRNAMIISSTFPPYKMTKLIEQQGYKLITLLEDGHLIAKFSKFGAESLIMKVKPETGFFGGFIVTRSGGGALPKTGINLTGDGGVPTEGRLHPLKLPEDEILGPPEGDFSETEYGWPGMGVGFL